jgi:predicted nuclease with TOPRIM domain
VNSNRNGIVVSSSEAERFTLHQTLRTLMPEAVADTLMSHLLPAGWSDVARASDIDALRTDTAQHFGNMRAETNAKFDNVDARFDALRIEIDALRADTKEKFDKIDARFEQLEAKLEVRFDKIDARFEQIEAKFDARFEKIDQRFDELASMKRYVITTGIAIIATICAAWSPLWFELL